MLVIQIFGAILVAAGLGLFAYDQIKGSRAKGDYAGLQAFKIQVGGPPALILIVIGVLVFMFPFTPWVPEDDPPPISTTTTGTLPTTTTVAATTTTRFTLETLDPSVFTLLTLDPSVFTLVPAVPLAPASWFSYFDSSCGGDGNVVEWETSAGADFYEVDVYVEDYNFNFVSNWSFDWEFTNLCVISFDMGPGLIHTVTVWPVNDAGWGDPTGICNVSFRCMVQRALHLSRERCSCSNSVT